MDSARYRAVEVLARVIDRHESLTPVLDDVAGKLPRAEQALLKEIAFGSLRWYLRLNAVLAQLLMHPFRARDRDLHFLLISALYQLDYLRIPDYAVVNTAVELTRTRGKAWAGKLVNGVLRRFLRERESLSAQVDQDPAQAAATPTWLYRQWQADWSEALAEILAASNRQAPMTLRVNEQRLAPAVYGEALQAGGIAAKAHPYASAAWVLTEALPVHELPGFAAGEVSVQDAGAQLAASLLAPQTGQRVLDACAAPGGKTCHLLEKYPGIELTAVELDGKRLQRIQENLNRLKLSARLIHADAAEPVVWWDGRGFERILLDAPCSGTGVIRRHPDIKHLRRAEDLTAMAEIQLRLLSVLWPLLVPGGMLLYATCSICRRENDAVIGQFLKQQAQACELPITAPWGRALPHGRQILPGEAGMDGFYYALLQKPL